MTQEEKIKDLEERIAIMQADSSKLLSELEHWKRVASGAKGRNKQLSERIEHYKNLDLEGDHRQERCDVVPKKDYEELEKTLESKKVFIEQLQERVQTLSLEKATLESTITLHEGAIKDLEHGIDELSKPWWKKVFVKIMGVY